jgi:hypothetical protein
MGDDKNPQDSFKETIKSVVQTANKGLEQAQTTIESWKAPVSSTLHIIDEKGHVAMDTVKTIYQRRHEFAPEIIGGTTVTTGGYFFLRRGRLAGLLGAAVGAGAAYAVVYDEFDLNEVPNVIFGKKEK